MKQEITLQQGIAIEKAREIVKKIKDSKLKVQASIQGDFVRVAGKDRDTLQSAIKLLRDTRFRHRHAVHQLPHQLTCRAASNRTALAGPAGRLEALLEEPEDGAPRMCGGGLPSAPALRRHHAQQGGLPAGARIAPRGHGGAALQFPRRGPQRGRARASDRRNRRRARGARLAARALSRAAFRAGRLFLRLARHHAAGMRSGRRACS